MRRCRNVLGLIAVALVTSIQPSLATGQDAPRKTVRILATGGTIAGEATPAAGAYRSGAVPIDEIIKSMPGIENLAVVTSEQVANLGGADVDEALWRKLLARIEVALADPEVSGLVVTHGTDTLEETAFFLSLVLPSQKPVVVVGAMRTGSTASADGPQNLRDAITVASADSAAGRGVMVVMNDTIFDPVSVTKVDFRRVNGLAAPLGGPIGDVLGRNARFYRSANEHPAPFALGADPLPKVAIAYSYAGFRSPDLRAIASGAAGLVLAGTGAGGIPTEARPAMRRLMSEGMTVVRTARQGSGDVWPAAVAGGEPEWTKGTIAGRELSPAKARILLMLALQDRNRKADIQQLFDQYGLTAP